MKKITLLFVLMITSLGYSQSLPFTFSNANELFAFEDCIVTLTKDPNDANNDVMQIVGGGKSFDNAQKTLSPVNLSDDANNSIFFRIKPVNGSGSGKHLLKFEQGTGGPAQVELTFETKGTNWQDIEVNFGAGMGSYPFMVIFTDFNNNAFDTYLIDDIRIGKSTTSIPGLPFTFSNENELFFGGECVTSLTTDPNDASNAVMQVIGSGVNFDNAQKSLAAVNLSDDTKNTISFRIKPMNGSGSGNHLLKFEQGTGGPATVELPFTTTGTEWQNIELDYGSGLGSYPFIVIFTDFNNNAFDTYLIDDIKLGESTGSTLTQMSLPVTFEDPTVNYGLIGFGGADDSTLVEDPTDASNTVAKVIKSNTAETWAGTTLSAKSPKAFSSNIPFTSTETKVSVRVWSPNAGIKVRLKVEDKNDVTRSCETDATVTTAAGWQNLVFNFANQAQGTAALNLSYSYNMASIFFNYGVNGATAGEKTYYFDDMVFGDADLAIQSFATTNVKMYPNPATDNVTINALNTIENVSFFNILGQEVLNVNPKSNSVNINVSELSKGIYIVKLVSEGKNATSKFIKE
jgi:hypothetical protein